MTPKPAYLVFPKAVSVFLLAIFVIASPPIVAAAGAPSGTTPHGPVGESLRAWIKTHASAGVELEGVYFGEHDGLGASLRAGGSLRRDVGVFAASGGLASDEAYVSVPWSLVLCPESVTAVRPELATLLRSLREEYGSDGKSALMLALIHERFVAPRDSPWRLYLDALPDPAQNFSDLFDTPLYWDPSLLRELEGSSVLDDAITDQAKVRAVHNGFVKRAFSQKPFFGVFDRENDGDDAKIPSLAATQWAWSIVHSRASNVPGKGLVLIPLVDMINDKRGGGGKMKGTAEGTDGGDCGGGKKGGGTDDTTDTRDFAVYDAQYDRAVVYAKRDYSPGEEVTESYGAWSDADTLLSGGYLLPETGDDQSRNCVPITLSPENFATEVALGKVSAALRSSGFPVPWRVCVSLPGQGTDSTAKRVARWASIVSGSEGNTNEEPGEPLEPEESEESQKEKDLSQNSNAKRAGELLARLLQAQLAEYPTSVREDRALLQVFGEELEQVVWAFDNLFEFVEFPEEDETAPESALAKRTALEKRARALRRASLATRLRLREKKTLAELSESVARAGGDAFLWANGLGKVSGDKDELCVVTTGFDY